MRLMSSESLRTAAVLLTALTAFLSAAVTAYAAPADAQSRYQRERALCMKMRGDRADCLSEASTRLASTMPSRAEEAADILARNALLRCAPLAEPDRSDCVARIQGKGTTSGSVAAGGIYRELVTREVGDAPAAAPASAPK